jgi:hypothetical protein
MTVIDLQITLENATLKSHSVIEAARKNSPLKRPCLHFCIGFVQSFFTT